MVAPGAVGLVLAILAAGFLPSTGAAPRTGEQTAEPADAADSAATGEKNGSEAAGEPWRGFHVGPLRIGGALRVNFIHKDWDEVYQNPGELALDTARINLDLDAGRLIGSLEYRYYRDKFADGHDSSMLHHGWLGWKFNDRHEVQGGVTKVPFGILPYASHNWFFLLTYYVGFEDDYDLGVKYLGAYGAWNLQTAYFFRDEGHWNGDSDDSARYSYDLVREGSEGNAERGQVNLRLAHTLTHADEHRTELGLSLMGGAVENRNPLGGSGERNALAAHLNGTYRRWNLMLQAVRYVFDVENDPNLDASPDGTFVTKGAYDAAYHVASSAAIYSAGLAYTLPLDSRFVRSLSFYDDFSLMNKTESGYRDSIQNVLGCGIDAPPFYVYVDLATGRNHPWLGGDWVEGLAAGGVDTGWHTRFNINLGFYF